MLFDTVMRLWRGALNGRKLWFVCGDFLINFSPVVLWLFIFDHASHWIPSGIRPGIHSHVAFWADQFMFGDWWGQITQQLGAGALRLQRSTYLTAGGFWALMAALCALLAHRFRARHPWETVVGYRRDRWSLVRSAPWLIPPIAILSLNVLHCFAKQQNFTLWKDSLAWTSYVILHIMAPILTAIYLYAFHPPGVVKCFSFALGIQNVAGVLTHLLIPMASPWFTNMYGINDTEHVNYEQPGFAAGLTRMDTHMGIHLNSSGFHRSPIVFGAVPSLHSAIAFQCLLFVWNRSGSMVHRFRNATRVAPMVSAAVNCSSEDFSSADDDDLESSTILSLGGPLDLENALYSNDYKLQSGEYSLLYIEDRSLTESFIFKIIFAHGRLALACTVIFVHWQWWSTLYLDHHYRFDLFVGVVYAMISYSIVNYYVLQPRILKPWFAIRKGEAKDERNEARTMGMRVFQDTRYECMFDPLA